MLHLTDDIPSNELYILNKIQKSNPAGLILCSCQTEPSLQLRKLEKKQCPTLFLFREIEFDVPVASAAYNNKETAYRITNRLIENETLSIGIISGLSDYSSEQEAIKGFKQAFESNYVHLPNHIHSLPNHKEEAFRSLALFFTQIKIYPTVFYQLQCYSHPLSEICMPCTKKKTIYS